MRRGPGELEAEVLAALWAAGTPLTSAEVQRRLGDDLAYTTVVTILSRLHAKGTLAREQRGKAHAYWPVADESGLAARRMRQVLDAEPDRLRVLAQFVSHLSDEDEQALRHLLGRAQPPTAGRRETPVHRETSGHPGTTEHPEPAVTTPPARTSLPARTTQRAETVQHTETVHRARPDTGPEPTT